jgi:hypothetical protein
MVAMNNACARTVKATHEMRARTSTPVCSSRYKPDMARTLISSFVLAALAVPALADPAGPPAPPPTMPVVGEPFGILTPIGWKQVSWLYDAPSAADSAGKVVVHWFCTASVKACKEDLARMINLRDAGRVYIVAYVGGGQNDAKKLDPIRESEGVGRGTVAYGIGVTKAMKAMGIVGGPESFVVDVDGTVKSITTSNDAGALDARDQLVAQLQSAIKEYVSSQDGPKTASVGAKFQLTFKVQLASWLAYDKTTPMEFTLSAPKDIKCDQTALRGDQLKIDGHTLSASVSCSAPRGIYEAQGKIRFGYTTPGGATGLGDDGTTWKFEIK